MIDTNRINSSQPIDLAAICNSKVFPVNPKHRHFGVNLTDEVADFFVSKKTRQIYNLLLPKGLD